MGENVICDDCLQQFIIEWQDGQYDLEDLIKKWFYNKSRTTKNEIKQFILSNTVPKCICETCGKFFFPPRPGKYCCNACKQKAYRERKKIKSNEK